MAITLNVKGTNNYFERTDTLVKYYHDANGYDVLDADKEKEMFMLFDEARDNIKKAHEAGDKELEAKYKKEAKSIRDFIVNSNLRFVISIARVYATNNNLLDLIEEGNDGLIEAVNTFKVSSGNRLQTYAVYFIRQKINLYRQNDDLLIRKNNESKTYHVISNMTNKFIQEFQREPSSEELKDYINEHYPNAKIKDSADVLNVRVSSIDETVDDDDANVSNITAYNTYSASSNDYEKNVEKEHLKSLISTIMRGLSERDKTVVKMYFGIEQKFNSPCPVSEIADKTKLTKERVRQIIADSKIKMREEYEKNISSILNN